MEPTVTFEEAFSTGMFVVEKATQTIEKYDATASYGSLGEEVEDATYDKHMVPVLEFNVENIKEQYMDQLVRGEAEVLKGNDLVALVDKGLKIAQDDYGSPDTLIKIDNNTFVLADIAGNTVRIKKLSETQGCIIVYCPRFSVILKLED